MEEADATSVKALETEQAHLMNLLSVQMVDMSTIKDALAPRVNRTAQVNSVLKM
ncbi:MAG: hypothetical protein ABJQ70_10945 [Roseobacter sp.]